MSDRKFVAPEKYLAICIPCIDKPHMVFSKSLSGLMYMLGIHKVRALTIHESGSAIHKVRNNLIGNVSKIEAENNLEVEWVLFLDSDMEFPPDLLFKLMAHQKDIIGCTYVRRSVPFDCLGKTLENKPQETGSQTLIEMAGMPTGCLLIKRSIFKTLKKPYFFFPWKEESEIGANDDTSFGEDYAFCAKARAAGHSIWLDAQLSKQVGHVSEKTLFPEQDSWPALKEAVNG